MEQETKQENQTKEFPIMAVVGIIVLFLIIAAAFYFYSKSKNAAMVSDQMIESSSMPESTLAPDQNESMMGEETSPNDAMEDSMMGATPSDSMVEGAMDEVMSQTISVEGGNYYFKPNVIKVKKGDKVTINFTNAGGTHNFVIDEFDVNSGMVGSSQTKTFEFTPTKTGTFEFYCSVGNHRQLGMKGSLIVE